MCSILRHICDPLSDIHAVFLDIFKAFDKIWLPGLIFKIKSFGISGDLLELIKNFLLNRFQSVVLNRQTSEWKKLMLECYKAQF